MKPAVSAAARECARQCLRIIDDLVAPQDREYWQAHAGAKIEKFLEEQRRIDGFLDEFRATLEREYGRS